MPDERALRREYLLDWTSAEGAIFYPEFATDPHKFVDSELTYDKNLPVYRGWDFGFRMPACVWCQLLPNGRVHVLRELLPREIDTHSFRDLVMYLSGQRLMEHGDYDPDEEIKTLQQKPSAWEWLYDIHEKQYWWGEPKGEVGLPFFPRNARFIDYSGPEAYRTQSIESESKERSDAQVLSARGINIGWNAQPVSYGETILRRLLLNMRDGRPAILFHPSCKRLIDGFSGGITYKKETKADMLPDTANKDGYYEHLHDALRYVAVNLIEPGELFTKPEYKEVRRSEPTPREKMEREEVFLASHELFIDPSDWWG